MPPEAATKLVPAKPLTDEDRRTLVRWIDLGCPIDLDYDPAHPDERGFGWQCDDKRPTLTLTYPQRGRNKPLSRIVVGMTDYYTGLAPDSFKATADFTIDGVSAGDNLASKFKEKSPGVWELKFAKPIAKLESGTLTVSVKDKQGNVTEVMRTFSIE